MERSFLKGGLGLAALTINWTVSAADATTAAIQSIGVPQDFEELQQERQVLADVYFQGRKIGETVVLVRPGSVRLPAPNAFLQKIDSLIASPELTAVLSDELPSNAALLCSVTTRRNCGTLSPDIAGIIYDEERFRLDLFINPRYLKTQAAVRSGYLPTPSSALSVTSVLGVAAAGTFGRRGGYSIQNRTVASIGNARIRISNALASGFGWVVDDLAAEVDRRSMRYSAGLFWAPGDDFIGDRRILGGGFTTQFDTTLDREVLAGTPLLLFLVRAAQVEILVDNRLVASRSYPPGNNELDTSALSDGSYLITLRIHEDGSSVRQEKRFFVKNARVAPVGKQIVYGFAGLLANSQTHRPLDLDSRAYFRAGVAVRLNPALAIDASVAGTNGKAVGQAGAWFLTRPATLRVAGLVSSKGDAGALAQLTARNAGPFDFSLDFRRLWSGDGGPLMPLAHHTQGFDAEQPIFSQMATGSYTQLVGSAGTRIGQGTLTLLGTYRKERGARADYSVGPSVIMPLASRSGFQLLFQASAQRSRNVTAAFASLRVLTARGRLSVATTLGQGMESTGSHGDDRSRVIGSVDAQYALAGDQANAVTGLIGAERDLRSAALRAGATYNGNLGNGRVELRHQLEGGRGTHYDVNFQSGLALNRDGATIGARQTTESALIIAIEGDGGDATYRILVDDSERGQVRAGQRLSLFLPAYRSYHVRLVPVDAPPVDYDPQAREVTLYPGNVASLRWHIERYAAFFGQAVSADGQTIRRALVQTGRNVAETDDQGYFQIDVAKGETLRFSRFGKPLCSVTGPAELPAGELVSGGKVVCK